MNVDKGEQSLPNVRGFSRYQNDLLHSGGLEIQGMRRDGVIESEIEKCKAQLVEEITRKTHKRRDAVAAYFKNL